MNRFKLNRRRFLRGLSVGSTAVVGLPLLEAMLNNHGTALAHGGDLPVRFMTWFWGDGVTIDQWEPAVVGDAWELSPQLAPLVNVKDYINVLTGLENRRLRTKEADITHHEGMSVFNGYPFIPAIPKDTQIFASDAGGPTIDQRIADVIARDTPVRDVHVGISTAESLDDGGTTVLAMSHTGTPGNLVPNIPETDPREVWQLLFGEFVPRPDDAALRTSILDYVREDANRVKDVVGMVDRQRIDAHLQGVRELEQRILAMPPTCDIPDQPTQGNPKGASPEPLSEVTLAMAQLLSYAFTCDVTRVATVRFKGMVSETRFSEIGIGGSTHHNNSHLGPDDPDYQAGVTYQMQKLADALEVFQATPEGDGNLLDSMILMASSDCSSGHAHSESRQPILLAGRGDGYLKYPGTHYQTEPFNNDFFEPNASGNTTDVLLTCLQAFDPQATEVGADNMRSTTPLTDVLAE